jgi:hypothetical protein
MGAVLGEGCWDGGATLRKPNCIPLPGDLRQTNPCSKYQGRPMHSNFGVWPPRSVKREPTIDSTHRLLVQYLSRPPCVAQGIPTKNRHCEGYIHGCPTPSPSNHSTCSTPTAHVLPPDSPRDRVLGRRIQTGAPYCDLRTANCDLIQAPVRR